MNTRIEVGPSQIENDPQGKKYLNKIRSAGFKKVKKINSFKVYTINDELEAKKLNEFCKSALCDPVIENFSVNSHLDSEFDWICEIDFKPGVTDNEGRTATEALSLFLDLSPAKTPRIFSGIQLRLQGELTNFEVFTLAEEFFANTLIQRIRVASYQDFIQKDATIANPPVVTLPARIKVDTYDLDIDDLSLKKLSKTNVWALSLEEIKTIHRHFSSAKIQKRRKQLGLPSQITDVEIECLAQSWSEHCKHKIFAANIEYVENGIKEDIKGLFNNYIKKTTRIVSENRNDDFCLSVFKDNAGVIKFNEKWGFVFKVETHNSPSALDPYGGALTGIVGVNRDPFGTGMGAELLFNTDVFCLASPFTDRDEIPPGLLHPKRILEGVREGVEHGGNQSGIPTINGSVLFDERYLGKPLVYCGTGGILPIEQHQREGYEKYHQPGDKIVMTGGRIGVDGIHGATFSSEELHEDSPASAVQIGDPITQRRMYDFIIKARDLNLYSSITDNGAGGLSSSVGEMAEFTGGAKIDLALPPLKYNGVDPWEILVSESQERMTLAVPPDKLDEFMQLSEKMNVESTCLGEFTDNGFFEIFYDDKRVADLDMEFLHNGVPTMNLSTNYSPPPLEKASLDKAPPLEKLVLQIFSRLNVASKEYWVRQYDHEVKGGSVIKPLMGKHGDGPSDAGVFRPLLDSMEAVVISHGIVPRYSDIDAYHMAACALDEAVRNAVASGGNPGTFAALDNFCWPDPLPGAQEHEKKLAALVRANKALSDVCISYNIPLISGKDSMKNDARIGDQVISVPPTLLVSLAGKIEDARKAVSMDAKNPGDLVYIAGTTRRELGKSELLEQLNLNDSSVPKVQPAKFIKLYKKIHRAMDKQLVASCHDCSDGGLAVALGETAFAGRTGISIDLSKTLYSDEITNDLELLFSESAGRFVITVSPENKEEFEKILPPEVCSPVGQITREKFFKIKGLNNKKYTISMEKIFASWHQPLQLHQLNEE
ncbi:MAG: phosphoribosylformylglycinamidine synthase subunit PurS [Myxococcota bacterium]